VLLATQDLLQNSTQTKHVSDILLYRTVSSASLYIIFNQN